MADVNHYIVEAAGYGCLPRDRSEINALLNVLDDDREMSVTDRRNMDGHFVASAVVLGSSHGTALVIEHNFLRRTLFPGGHIDPREDPMVAAFREVREETGVMARPLLSFPIDLDSHDIPANPSKGEGPHRHHDMLFLGEGSNDQLLSEQTAEINNARWMSFDQLCGLPDARFKRVIDTIKRLMAAGHLSSI